MMHLSIVEVPQENSRLLVAMTSSLCQVKPKLVKVGNFSKQGSGVGALPFKSFNTNLDPSGEARRPKSKI